MEPWLRGALIGGLVGGLAGGLVALIIALVKPTRRCPDCGEPFPRFRRPANRRQTLWGGSTCAKCGCEVDRHGKRIESPE